MPIFLENVADFLTVYCEGGGCQAKRQDVKTKKTQKLRLEGQNRKSAKNLRL